MKATLKQIIEAVSREHRYQDAKHGTLEEHPHTVAEWLLIMESELNEAKESWCKGSGDHDALKEILQVVAVGIRALEQHGIIERENLANYPQRQSSIESLTGIRFEDFGEVGQ